ncbi:MAG: hypothetical protein JO147_05930 [Actinobacteria bacterium]|nr:hypothetical protein [Actinomycetota bacterium]
MTGELANGLLDDAAMFPPGSMALPDALVGHVGHRGAWYADMLGPFVCAAGRLVTLQERAEQFGIQRLDVAVIVTDGLAAVDTALARAAACPAVHVVALEVPIGPDQLDAALRALVPRLAQGCRIYVELPMTAITDRHAHDLSRAGLYLKLRTGGTSIEAFRTEAELARPIVLAAAERLAFKCTAGLHHAIRQLDRETGFEHHGFVNVLLAARVAAASGSVDATAAVLSIRDRSEIVARALELATADIVAVRALFRSFGTCSILEPVTDLCSLGLVTAP